MPPQPTVTQIRLNNITTCLTIAASTLEILVDSLKSPFLEAISNTTQSLLKNVESTQQTVRQNKNDCTQLLEQTYELLNAILMVHINSDTGAELPPTQHGSKPKKIFHQGEMSTLLKDCKTGLQEGLEIFQVPVGNHMKDLTQMQEDAAKRNKEVLDMIEALSDTTSSDRASSISGLYLGSHNSSNSISMLPSEPKIFHGRDLELSNILHLFSQGTPRIAIWVQVEWERPVLHELLSIIQKLLRATQMELAALIGAHVGLKPGKDLTHPVIQYFSSSSKSLLILDNLETMWEPVESRGKIEEFLSLLTGVDHLALVITMRGAERPAKVAWTHPFLPALKPLEQDAARQTFIDIADNTHDSNEADKACRPRCPSLAGFSAYLNRMPGSGSAFRAKCPEPEPNWTLCWFPVMTVRDKSVGAPFSGLFHLSLGSDGKWTAAQQENRSMRHRATYQLPHVQSMPPYNPFLDFKITEMPEPARPWEE
ncbi:hypothetical protein B0H13DRAFT_1916375 [Mycena leptocephala]|nr:hypothetical protein B0H13DRAFT_1916375 [Mycena leptocephala]